LMWSILEKLHFGIVVTIMNMFDISNNFFGIANPFKSLNTERWRS